MSKKSYKQLAAAVLELAKAVNRLAASNERTTQLGGGGSHVDTWTGYPRGGPNISGGGGGTAGASAIVRTINSGGGGAGAALEIPA